MNYQVEVSKNGEWFFHSHYPSLGPARDKAIELRGEGQKARVVMRIELEVYEP